MISGIWVNPVTGITLRPAFPDHSLEQGFNVVFLSKRSFYPCRTYLSSHMLRGHNWSDADLSLHGGGSPIGILLHLKELWSAALIHVRGRNYLSHCMGFKKNSLKMFWNSFPLWKSLWQ
jgi:hypothetical protein